MQLWLAYNDLHVGYFDGQHMLGISVIGQVALGELPSDETATPVTTRLPLFRRGAGTYWGGVS